MEVASQVNYTDLGNCLIIIGFVTAAVGLLGILLDITLDRVWATVIALVGCILASVLLLVGLYSKSRGIEYTVRIDNITTVSNLVNRYEIVSYDKDTDTWLVRDKEP